MKGTKEWFLGLKWWGKLIVGLVVLSAIGNFFDGSSASNTTITSTTNTTVAETPSSTETPTTTTTEKPKAWTEVFQFGGTGKKRSDTFTLTGAKARIKYTTKGLCYIYIVPESDSLEKSGGFPEIQTDGPESGGSMLAKDAGNYYLDVNGSGAFTIIIEEYR
ncbi:MAG TPA: hypothetical protein VE439_09740 [Anaerolineae bacterium]|nr:hypothetical protein [Anaerolineae bacterium]